VKDGEKTLADQVTPLRFDETDTYFDGPTAPFQAGGDGTVPGADANTAIVAEIKSNDVKSATLTSEIADLNKQIPLKQASLNTLAARTKALKAVPGLPS
jgi:hypothetical protein